LGSGEYNIHNSNDKRNDRKKTADNSTLAKPANLRSFIYGVCRPSQACNRYRQPYMQLSKIFISAIILLLIVASGFYFFPEKELIPGIQIDSLIVYKSKRELLAYSNGQIIKTYKIAIGRNPNGAKEYEGDNKTPEGIYYINNKNPKSGYHKNLGISYPETKDIRRAKLLSKPTGGDVKIHGLRNDIGFVGKFHRWFSTRGCIRVTNKEMDELYYATKTGTRIIIYP
jgi:hypothetical protein